MTPHRNVQIPGSTPPRGYSDGTLASGDGDILFLGGHVAFDSKREIQDPDKLVLQVERALRNLLATLEAAGGKAENLTRLTIYTVDVGAYRAALPEIGSAWRSVLGPVYPATTLIGVLDLFDPGAVVEIDGVAVIPRP